MMYRLDINSLKAKDEKYCYSKNPSNHGFVCTRPQNHKGMHFAQYFGTDGLICHLCKPNPWSDEHAK